MTPSYPSKSKVLLVEPFYSGSHMQWANAYQQHSNHDVGLLTLPGKHWKWRMEGGAVKLAERFKELKYNPDLILCSDMLNLPLFQSLAKCQNTSTVLYMHENQISYPWSPEDKEKKRNRDFHYGFINYSSCLAADEVWFNSGYHLNSFIEGLAEFLKMFPDHREMNNIDSIIEKSLVIPIGMDFASLEKQKEVSSNKTPIILWNHRWEFDKNPALFFNTLKELSNDGYEFQLVVLGEKTNSYPPVFDSIKLDLSKELLHIGFCENKLEYYRWIWKSDILPVTSKQDFFGISTIEAIYCQCTPLLPHRLAFPEHIPKSLKDQVFYQSESEFKQQLKKLVVDFSAGSIKISQESIRKYDWSVVGKKMDLRLSQLIKNADH